MRAFLSSTGAYPMRILVRVILGLVALLVALAGIGFFLPKEWSVEQSISVQAPPERIHPFIETPTQWAAWTVWNKERYPDMTQRFVGPERGKGASWSWTGESTGNGTMTITGSDPAKGITFDLQFEDFPVVQGAIRLEKEGAATRVIWAMDGTVHDDPLSRWFARVMGPMMKGDLQGGLEKLKAQAESTPAVAAE